MASDQWSGKAKLGFAALNPTYRLNRDRDVATTDESWESEGSSIAGDLRLQGFGRNRGKGISIARAIHLLDSLPRIE